MCACVCHTHKGPLEARSQVEGPGHLPLECPSHHLRAGDGITSWVAALPSSLGSLRLQNRGSLLARLFSHLLLNILWLRALDQESTLQPLVRLLQQLILKFRQASSLGGPPFLSVKCRGWLDSKCSWQHPGSDFHLVPSSSIHLSFYPSMHPPMSFPYFFHLYCCFFSFQCVLLAHGRTSSVGLRKEMVFKAFCKPNIFPYPQNMPNESVQG